MAVPQPSGVQIYNDGACIRIEKNGKTLLLAKDQVKTIDTVHDNIIRIDIGEGPLKNIFLNYQDVGTPEVQSANELRDNIKAMMLTDAYLGGDAKEVTQLSVLTQLTTVATLLQGIKDAEKDFTKSDPSRTDESNPYIVYHGWHGATGDPAQNEWAIQRVRKEDDIIIYEWAFGTKGQANSWDARDQHTYAPFNASIAI